MNKEQLSQRIGNMDDRLVAQAEHMPTTGGSGGAACGGK